jgi:hypothetical protein
VTQEVADVLANPTCYMKVFHSIFPIDTLEEKADGTFWPLIHVLACRGVYVVNEGQSVTHTILSQTKPFEVVCTIYLSINDTKLFFLLC